MGKYLDKIRQHERTQPVVTEEASTQQQALDPIPIHPSNSDPVVIEPAAPNPRPVFWERGDGSIVGPGRPEFLARVGNGPKASFWVVAQFQGVPVWLNSIRLRSKRQFDKQIKPMVVERIREPR